MLMSGDPAGVPGVPLPEPAMKLKLVPPGPRRQLNSTFDPLITIPAPALAVKVEAPKSSVTLLLAIVSVVETELEAGKLLASHFPPVDGRAATQAAICANASAPENWLASSRAEVEATLDELAASTNPPGVMVGKLAPAAGMSDPDTSMAYVPAAPLLESTRPSTCPLLG